MLTSDSFRNLRAGPVLEAGRMNDATIRGLVANHDLKLGDRDSRKSGNPRYDLADCARVYLLHILIRNLKQRPAAAVWAVNKARAHIAMIADIEIDAIGTGKPPECPRYIFSLSALSMDSETNPDIRLYSDPEEIAERESSRGLMCAVKIDLREVVRYARDQLAMWLEPTSFAGLRHDFADALEVRDGTQHYT